MPDGPEYPLSNYGLIEVRGTDTARAEIEFQRAPGVPDPGDPVEKIRPFLNLPLPPGDPVPGNGRTGGEIVGQDATFRFDSGIINRHKVSFTGGTNFVTGNFENEGTVLIGGEDTSVTFVDQFFNRGVLQLEPDVSDVTFIDDVAFEPAGVLNLNFNNHISSAEDIVLGGVLNASLGITPNFPSYPPQAGDRFEVISSALDLVGNFAVQRLPPCIGSVCFIGVPDYTLDAFFIEAFAVPPAGSGPDFNGDGIVDDTDYAIWRANFGTAGPAGDANGDGSVDAADYTIWRDNCCGAFPGAGSGSGNVAGGTVPEPTAVGLAACAALLVLAFGRRQK